MRPRPPAPTIRPTRSRAPLSRRDLLRSGAGAGAALGGAALLAACGGDDAGTSAPGGATGALIAGFPQSVPHAVAGVDFRLPYLVTDAEGVPRSSLDGPVRFTVLRNGEQVGKAVTVRPHDDGVPRAYLPLVFNFPEPGTYDVVARVGGADLDSALQVYTRDQVDVPVPGDPLPPVNTPTTADARGVDPVCTRTTPCPFHQVDLADALAQGRPVALLVATPAYCQTDVCGPIVDNLMAVAGDRDDLAVIHAEVYANPTAVSDIAQATLAPLPAAYRLDFEPVLFVTDASGTVVARGDVTVDRPEMEQLLALATR